MTTGPVVVWLTEGTWRSTVDAAAAAAPADAAVVLLHVVDVRLEEADVPGRTVRFALDGAA